MPACSWGVGRRGVRGPGVSSNGATFLTKLANSEFLTLSDMIPGHEFPKKNERSLAWVPQVSPRAKPRWSPRKDLSIVFLSFVKQGSPLSIQAGSSLVYVFARLGRSLQAGPT
jgi:hypothetical protein